MSSTSSNVIPSWTILGWSIDHCYGRVVSVSSWSGG